MPTGYPEGRRVWVAVSAPRLGLDLGRFDANTGEPIAPAAIYEARHGTFTSGPGPHVALNDTIMIFAFAPIVGLLLGIASITVPWDTLITSVVLYIVIPVILAQAWRRLLLRRGQAAFEATVSVMGRWSIGALLLTLVLLFAFQGEAICQPRNGRVTQHVDLNGRDVAITSLHLDWPWPKHHWRQIDKMAPTLRQGDGPALLGGDFNAAPWSAAVRAVAAEGGLRIVRGIGPSWLTVQFKAVWPRWLGLPIDQLLVSSDVVVERVETLSRTSSDHLPVLLRFSLLPRPGDPAPRASEPATASAHPAPPLFGTPSG